jgi:hypothetical protein
VRITGIGLENGRYVVDYETSGYTEQLPGRHVHFYFDTVPESEAGVPGKGPWILYGGPRPFTQYGVADRPEQATAMCARVANEDHSIILGSGNCYPLPDPYSVNITSIGLENGSYVVNYETSGYTEQLPGRHVHFYFNTVPEAEAGKPGNGPWILYGGPRPFTQYGVSDRPAQATEMCARVANTDHSIIHGSGNCYPLPDPDPTTVTLQASKDNTLYNRLSSVKYHNECGLELSNGKGEHFFTGIGSGGQDVIPDPPEPADCDPRPNRPVLRRGVLAFDLDSIPSGAEILKVTLKLNLTKASRDSGDKVVSLHTLNKDWGEGASEAGGGEGRGALAVTGDATWRYSNFNSIEWTSAGGDFNAAPSGSKIVGTSLVEYSWSSDEAANEKMKTDVQNWLENPSSNFGWLLKGEEEGVLSARAFASHENQTEGKPPKLIVEYNTKPADYAVSITGIGLDNGRYVVDYETSGYTEQLPGRHVHFYFDTVAEADAGVPGNGPWILYGGPRPFTQYGVSDRPTQANAMCARVAEADHSIIFSSGNCFPLP